MPRGIIQNNVQDPSGNALVGATVTIKVEGTSTLATLYTTATGGTTLPNPLETAERGYFYAYVEAGDYDVIVGSAAGSYTFPSVSAIDADDVGADAIAAVAAVAADAAAAATSAATATAQAGSASSHASAAAATAAGMQSDLDDAAAAAVVDATAAADASAAAALVSENNAATSETNAAASETNADTSASNAATSETNAAQSAVDAETERQSLDIYTKVANYTLASGDELGYIRMNIAGANTLTVPTNATVAFEVGVTVTVGVVGAGSTTITPAGGVTLNGDTEVAQDRAVVLIKVATDEWDIR